ncbi:MAG: S9 family peptidase [Pseudomonadota bacterium]
MAMSSRASLAPFIRTIVIVVTALFIASCGGGTIEKTEEDAPLVDASQSGTKNQLFTAATSKTAPAAERRDKEYVQFGETRVDPYAWLRDEKWRDVLKDPSVLQSDIRDHLEAENAYYVAAVDHLSGLRKTLFAEMRGRIKEDESSVPALDGPFAYAVRYVEGGEYPIFVRTPRDGGEETILYDGDKESDGAAFFDVGEVEHSPNHALIAYTVDRVGSEFFSIRVRNIETGEEFSETVENADSNIVWASDSQSFYYIERDANQRPKRVKRHALGADPAGDALVYEEADDGFFLGISKSQSGDYIFISAGNGASSEVRALPSDAAAGATPLLIAARQDDVLYNVEHHGDQFYIHTNADGAIDFKIMHAPVSDPSKDNWETFLPAHDGVYVRDFIPFQDYIVRLETQNALPRIVVSDWALSKETEIAFDEAAYALGLVSGYEYDVSTVRFRYESPSTPQETYDYDIASGARTLLKKREIPSGHNKDNYVVERLSIRADDGASLPVTLLRRKDVKQYDLAPLLLYGYGSYGYAMPASFNSRILSLVDRGAIYAIAHVRGGSDKGRNWYLDGKLDKKKNTFSDFGTVAASLQSMGWTTSERTVAFGGSAGGLLVGATVNAYPEVFGGVIGAVPFVDVLTTISDETLPLTPPEWEEWGDPIRDESAYRNIKSYSPYDNIDPDKTYPPILATGGLADYRVTYWEPAKWTARLRADAKGGPFFLRMDMDAGHGGSAARFKSLEEYAEYYAFALEIFGLVDEEPISHQ